MSVDPSLTRYPPTARALHWLTALAVLVIYGVTYLEAFFARGTPARGWIWWTHISVGLLLLVILALRIPNRIFGRMPAPSRQLSRPVVIASEAAHGLLYLLVIVTPLVGIYLAFLRGDAVTFFSLFTIPSPLPVDRTFARTVQGVHEWLANGLVIVALAHAAAAIGHHVILKDDVLKRMLPDRGS
ncbi:cytochrome b [Xanthobacter sp. V4C-4]|uniref:cytochrome b n=1 Tax=Xanthobacter cornucopiae TaxID=3119924 RepID=UPI00372BBB3D